MRPRWFDVLAACVVVAFVLGMAALFYVAATESVFPQEVQW